LQSLGIHDAKLQLLNDLVERWLGHGVKSGVSAVDRVQMPPKLAFLNADETTAIGLRLMKCFLTLRSQRHREELIALAERLVKAEEKLPAEPAD
jgi:hypothetical protein